MQAYRDPNMYTASVDSGFWDPNMFTVTKYIKFNMLDFMYFINVNILGSQHVHSICWVDLLEGLMMTV